MSLILFSPLALAARIYWTAPPSDADAAAIARTLPDATAAPIHDLITGGAPSEDPAAAIDALRRELEAVRPLADQFDGELQIMARLSKATSEVRALRDPADAELLWRALVFEGFAVHRYFQDKLGDDPAAAPYRTGEGLAALPTPWLDAVGIMGPRKPNDADLPEPNEKLAYDAVRATATVMPTALVEVGALASGSSIRLDGQVVEPRQGVRTLVVPGRHLFRIESGGAVLMSVDTRFKPSANAILTAPFGPTERDALVTLANRGSGWDVPAAAMVPIGGVGEPVYLAIPGQPRLLRVDSGKAEAVRITTDAASKRFAARVAVGAGWVSDGDFFLLHVEDGAPYDESSVNAGTPAFSVGGEARFGTFAAGVGVDAQIATGEYHSLTTGAEETRAFVYPHVAVGVPWVQATVGYLFPWHVGVGAQAHLGVYKGVEVFASGVYGLGLEQDRGADPAFQPQPLIGAWGGVAYRFD